MNGPVSEQAITRIEILDATFRPADHAEQLSQNDSDNGALVTFTGMVRDLVENPVNAMYLEHYPGMTEQALETIIATARQRWVLGHVTVIHRVGMLYPGEPIVFVGVTSRHRREAFEACQFIMDFLKMDAPFWKKEYTPEGERWVEAKSSDSQAAQRW
ncbi:MAG TPA: molybdopterin synthase catalytic subunit MoaE [Porticoccaceae bacterium]|nr:molybdopterin synthase catalytic subunit MoaE [Porticoccaceae bacterium]HCO61112.1 molybdopterin synthase catalytic subunit MoaE [Porticoccaceae bacterium]